MILLESCWELISELAINDAFLCTLYIYNDAFCFFEQRAFTAKLIQEYPSYDSFLSSESLCSVATMVTIMNALNVEHTVDKWFYPYREHITHASCWP